MRETIGFIKSLSSQSKAFGVRGPACGLADVHASTQVVAYLHGLLLCRISAAAGQVILAMDPVISIALGYLVNRNETHLGPLGIAGGATLLGACLLASFYAKKEH